MLGNFSEKLVENRERLYRYALSLAHNKSDADDLVQETFYKAQKFRDKFSTGTNIGAWLTTILRNTYINIYRKKKRVTVINLDEIQNVVSCKSKDAVCKDIAGNLSDEVQKAINEISEEFITPFLLSLELTYKEIARVLHIPMGTAMSRIHRARKQLRYALEDYAIQEGIIFNGTIRA